MTPDEVRARMEQVRETLKRLTPDEIQGAVETGLLHPAFLNSNHDQHAVACIIAVLHDVDSDLRVETLAVANRVFSDMRDVGAA